MFNFKTLRLLAILTIIISSFSTNAYAACTLNGTNGKWHAVFNDNITGIPGFCEFTFRATGMLPGSVCSDENGDFYEVTNSTLELDKEECSTEVTFEFLGHEYLVAFSYDRAVTVAVGVFVSETAGAFGTINMVKKTPR